MSDLDLDEDFTKWPTSAHLLLGVPAAIRDAKELKRAYTRRIKRFKPEQFPEHFRILREAYETMQNAIDFRLRYSINDDAIDEASSSTATSETVLQDQGYNETESFDRTPSQSLEVSREAANPIADETIGDSVASTDTGNLANSRAALSLHNETPLRDPLKEIHDAVSLALLGNYDEAFAKLRAEQKSHGPNQHLARALEFWIAKISSNTSGAFSPSQIAFRHLSQGYCSYSEIFAAALEANVNPNVLLQVKLNKLVDADRANNIDYFLQMRWQVAARSDNYRIIMEDCKLLNDLYFDRLTRWLTISYQAVHYLLWAKEIEVVEYGMQLAKALDKEYVSLPEYAADLSRIDILITITKNLYDYIKNPVGQKEYWRIFALGWNCVAPDWKRVYLEWMHKVASTPRKTITAIDNLLKRNSLLLSFLRDRCLQITLPEQEDSVREETEPELDLSTDLIIRAFLSSKRSLAYGELREEVLDFCVREAISPSRLCTVIKRQKKGCYLLFKGEFTEQLSQDVTLSFLFDIISHRQRLAA